MEHFLSANLKKKGNITISCKLYCYWLKFKKGISDWLKMRLKKTNNMEFTEVKSQGH